MGLADLLGLSSAAAAAPQVGQDMTPEQLNALPYVNVHGRAPAAAAPAAAPQSGGLGNALRGIFGALGDGLLAQAGRSPIYTPAMLEEQKRQRLGSSLSQYLGDTDPMLGQIFQADPETGVALYKMRHPAEPDFLRDMRAAGIDPTTEQGQSLVAAHFGKQPAAGIAEYQYYQQHGGTLPFGDFLRILHPPAGGSLEETAGAPAGNAPFVNSPDEARNYPPGTLVNTPYGHYRVPGGR